MEQAFKPRRLDQVRDLCWVRHYSIRTEQASRAMDSPIHSVSWQEAPEGDGCGARGAFLTYLAVEGNVAPSTQNQALAALLFLYKVVLGVELPWLDNVTRAKKPARLPVVLSEEEVRQVLAHLSGHHWLAASLMYGSGLRLMESLRLRVKDVDFQRRELTVRQGKGGKDRRTMVPESLVETWRRAVERVRIIHEQDLKSGVAPVYLPYAPERKYPNAGVLQPNSICFPARGPDRITNGFLLPAPCLS